MDRYRKRVAFQRKEMTFHWAWAEGREVSLEELALDLLLKVPTV